MDEDLTARTRSNDVLPAFCSPIIVTSISVTLPTSISTTSNRRDIPHKAGLLVG
jgi:hypothetical protein